MADYQVQFYVGGSGLKVNDLVQARKVDYDQRSYKRILYEVLGRVTDVSREGQATISIYQGAENLSRFGKNMTFTRIGNTTDASRQASIFITSDDIFNTAGFDSQGAAPYIDIRDGVNSYASRGDISTLRFRAGNLTGLHDDDFGTYQPSGYGVYTDSIFAKGTFILGAGSKGFAMLDDAPQSIADLDANYGPMFMDYPMSSGLFINTSRLGYYNRLVAQETGNTERGWMTYMSSDGSLLLRGKVDEDAYFLWQPVDGTGHSSLTLSNADLNAAIVLGGVGSRYRAAYTLNAQYGYTQGWDWSFDEAYDTHPWDDPAGLHRHAAYGPDSIGWYYMDGNGYVGGTIAFQSIYNTETSANDPLISITCPVAVSGDLTSGGNSIATMSTALTGKADKSAVNGEYEITYSGTTLLSMTVVDGVITAIS